MTGIVVIDVPSIKAADFGIALDSRRNYCFNIRLYFLDLALNHDFELNHLTFHPHDLNLTATTNPHLMATSNCFSSWPTCPWRLVYSLDLEISGTTTQLISRENWQLLGLSIICTNLGINMPLAQVLKKDPGYRLGRWQKRCQATIRVGFETVIYISCIQRIEGYTLVKSK